MYLCYFTSCEMWTFPLSCIASVVKRNFEWKLQRIIRNTHYEEPSSIESLKDSASKVWFEVFCSVNIWIKTSIKNRLTEIQDGEWYQNATKRLPTAVSLKLDGFTRIPTYILKISKCSFHCCIVSYEKCCSFWEYRVTDRHTYITVTLRLHSGW